MSCYEVGYDPKNEFRLVPRNEEVYTIISAYWPRYIQYQCHSRGYCSVDESSWFVDAVMRNSALGIKVATCLQVLSPFPYESHSRRVLVRDAVGPGHYYGIGEYFRTADPKTKRFSFYKNGMILAGCPRYADDTGRAHVFYDDKYVVVVDDGDGKDDIVITVWRHS